MFQETQSTCSSTRNFGQQAGSARLAQYKEKGVQVGTYPDMEQKLACMKIKEQDSYPQIDDTDSKVLMILRGNKEYGLKLKNAFTRDKRIVQNYGGEFVGLSEDICRCEGDLYRGQPEACFVLLRFKEMASAQRWTESSPIFKQKDWPTPADELEIFAIPLKYKPTQDLTAFQLIEMHGLMTPSEQFQKEYVKPVASKLNEKRIYHGVVATSCINRLRNCRLRPDTYVLVHCADSLDTLKRFYDSAEYSTYKEYRHRNVAENDSCFFTIKH